MCAMRPLQFVIQNCVKTTYTLGRIDCVLCHLVCLHRWEWVNGWMDEWCLIYDVYTKDLGEVSFCDHIYVFIRYCRMYT